MANGAGIAVVGRVSSLDLQRITVQRTTCSVSGRVAAVAGGFAVGENVAIGCAHGALQTIRLVPLEGGSSHPVPYLHVTTKLAPPTGSGAKASLVWSSGTITSSNSGTVSSSAPVTVTISGPITSLTTDAIAVAGTTCLFYASDPRFQASTSVLSGSAYSTYNYLTREGVAVGDSADLSCTYSGTSSSGKLTVR
jgi:hypothetical protein